MTAKKTTQRGDPALVDRLVRAMGHRQSQTGEAVSWKDLGELLKLSASSMTDLSKARRKVEIAEAKALADYLGVSFAWLCVEEGPMVRTVAKAAPAPAVKPLRRGEAVRIPQPDEAPDPQRRVAVGGLRSLKGAKRGRPR